jgi:PAS domain S-box-containing protein
MTIRRKALGVIALTVAGLIVAVYLSAEVILLPSFLRLEKRQIERTVQRVMNIIASERNALRTVANDWSSWDDTYSFVQTGNPSYIKSNLVNGTFKDLGLDLIMIVDLRGRTVFAGAYDRRARKRVPVPRGLRRYMSGPVSLAGPRTLKQAVSGLVVLGKRLMLVASLPILTSEDRGPARGALIMGRFLDSALIRRLANLSGASLRLIPYGRASTSARVRRLSARLSSSRPILFQTLDQDRVAGYVRLDDLRGVPTAIIEVTLPRTLWAQGLRTVIYMVVLLVAAGGLICLIVLFLFDRIVVAPVSRLSRWVKRLGDEDDLSARIQVDGHDEVADLGRAINQMLETRQGWHEQWRSLVEDSFDGIFVQRGDRIVFANRRLDQMLGYDNGELVGQEHWRVYHPEFRELTRSRAQARLRGEHVPSRYDVKLLRRDGTSFYGEINARSIVVEGEPGIQVWVHDITSRKRAEEALKRGYEQLNTFYALSLIGSRPLSLDGAIEVALNEVVKFTEVVSVGLYLWDEDRQRLVYNQWRGLSDDFARQVAELELGQGVTGTAARDRRAIFVEDYVHDDSSLVAARREGMVSLAVIPLLRGEQLLGTLNIATASQTSFSEVDKILYTSLGQILSTNLSLSLDTAELLRAEAALRQSEERYRELYRESSTREQLYQSLLHSTPDAVAIYNLNGEVAYVNPAFTSIFGFSLDELRGRKTPFVPDDQAERTLATIKRVLAGEPVSAFETKRFTKFGDVLDIVLSSSRYYDAGGEPAGIVVILRDVTQTKRMEDQLRQAQKMEAVGTLAGGVAHDFNNILQAISGCVQLMMSRPDIPEDDRHYMVEIEGAAQRASALVKRLLTFSRKVETELRPINLNDQIRHAVEILGRTMPKMITIDTRLAEDLRAINADAIQLEQVLINLGTNARDAMPEGGRLVFETDNPAAGESLDPERPEADPRDYVRLRVTDTGQGIDEKHLGQIFDPFFTTKEVGKGTGLGLAMVYGIVKSHGGMIACHSRLGQGTTFELYWPAARTEAVEAAPRQQVPEDLPSGDETILLVDDERSILDVAGSFLTDHGYTILEADTGERALEVYEDQGAAIDLVVLDLGMPGMGGRRCLEALRRLDPAIKVLVASGYSDDGLIKGVLETGAAGFIPKPYRLTEMLKKVREVLDEKT